MPLTSALLAPPLDKKRTKQNLDGLNISKASHIGLAFHSPPRKCAPSLRSAFIAAVSGSAMSGDAIAGNAIACNAIAGDAMAGDATACNAMAG
jgi:hypothetical protein